MSPHYRAHRDTVHHAALVGAPALYRLRGPLCFANSFPAESDRYLRAETHFLGFPAAELGWAGGLGPTGRGSCWDRPLRSATLTLGRLAIVVWVPPPGGR